MPTRRPTRREFNLHAQLYMKHAWLREDGRPEAFNELVGLCNSVEEHDLLIRLLHRFAYIDDARLRSLLRGMVRHITKVWQLAETRTQIVATTMDTEGDSSQAILFALKPEFKRIGWDNARTTNRLAKARRYAGEHPHIVLVDEFIGTGKTIESRVRWLKNDLKAIKGPLPEAASVRVAAVACTAQARHWLRKCGIDVHAQLILRKGISGFCRGRNLRDACEQMVRLERELARSHNGLTLPCFGSGHSQALYGSSNNVPNNVFPIFWWAWLAQGGRRKTLLHRLELARQ